MLKLLKDSGKIDSQPWKISRDIIQKNYKTNPLRNGEIPVK